MNRFSLLMLLLLSAARSDASALPLEIESESSVYDPLTNRVDFTVSFNRIPNLFTADAYGRQADGFQYWIFYDNNPFQIRLPPELSALIRGVEVFVHGDLPIRNAYPPAVGDPHYGGWGGIRAAIPFALADATLTFSVDLSELGDDDGKFSYRFDTFEFGDTTDSVVGGTAGPYKEIPEPESFLLATTALLVAVRQRSQRERRRGF